MPLPPVCILIHSRTPAGWYSEKVRDKVFGEKLQSSALHRRQSAPVGPALSQASRACPDGRLAMRLEPRVMCPAPARQQYRLPLLQEGAAGLAILAPCPPHHSG